MVTLRELLQRPGKSHFMTVHAKGEVHGEIEPEFYKEFRAELGKLGKYWVLYDANGLRLRVEFNDDDKIPRITNGWMTLREFYNLQGHHHIFFRYLGGNAFHIIPIMEQITPASFPTWHTKTRSLRKAVAFKVIVSEDPTTTQCLTLPNAMGEYLVNTGLDNIDLVGPNGESQICELDADIHPFEMRLSTGWREFASRIQIGVGYHIQFNMCNLYDNHSAWVRKLD